MALVIYDPGYRIQTPMKSVLPDRMVEQLTEPHASRAIPSSENRLDRPEAELPSGNRQMGQKAQQAYQQNAKLKRRQSDSPDLLVDKIMSSPVISILAGASLAMAWQQMDSYQLQHLAVINDRGQLMGILTERDLLRRHALMPHAGPHNPRQNIDGGYSTQLIVATADTPVRQVAMIMHERQISCVPIIGANGIPRGMVTRSDLLPLIINDSRFEQWA